MNYSVCKLTSNMQVPAFHCTDNDLNEFLLEDAKKYLNDYMAVTYLFVDTDNNKTIAYFSLLNDKVAYNPLEKNLWNKINRFVSNSKRRKSYPSMKIGRLAVSSDYVHSGIGTKIVNFIKNLLVSDPIAGCRFLTVDAYSNVAEFYKKNGFDFFTMTDAFDSTRLMYFDLKRIPAG